MRKQKRHAAITIEYLIFSIVILGIGACLLSFQGEIENSVTIAQTSFASLQENLTNDTTSTNQQEHVHNWEVLRFGRLLEGQSTPLYGYNVLYYKYPINITIEHYCASCDKTEYHSFVTMTLEGAQEIIDQAYPNNNNSNKIENIVSRTKCETCGYYYIEWQEQDTV